MGRPICVSPGVRRSSRRVSPYPAAGRSDPRGSEGLRVSASARARARSADGASRRRASLLVALSMLALVGLTLWVLGVRDLRCYAAAALWVPTHQRRTPLEPLDPAGIRACRCSGGTGIAVDRRRGARSGRLGKAPPLADVRLDDRYSETSCRCGGRRDRARRDVRLVGGHRLRRIGELSGSRPEALGDPGREQLLASSEWRRPPDCLRRRSGAHRARWRRVARGLRRLRATRRRRVAHSRARWRRRWRFSPIVWLHYLVVLLVPVAILRPRFSAIWLLPVLLWVSPKPGLCGGVVATFVPAVAVAIVLVALLARPVPGRGAAPAMS